jgi:two-component system chemotaxis response regulator CheY
MAYTIMVVDDSETIRCMLERSLKMTQLPVEMVIHAENGKDALAKMAEHWVDIVFSDIHMPVMTGIELVESMGRDAELRDIPVVIVSTEGSTTRIEELTKMGIKGYLRKPFTPEKVRDVIVSTLGAWNA